ncbi:MAG: AgmX/PglI C-terminal domain-containing protein [Nannocystaceae bacterium]|nr:AgmX/PglI C-terminal domain-containing protein [Nannocystaceae bacterium]
MTLEKVQVGEVTVALTAGAFPKPGSPPQGIVEALLASEHPVAWVADAGVPAATLRMLVGVLPQERTQVLVMQTSKGQQGALTLASTVPAGAPQVRIASDGFHLAQSSLAKEYALGPDKAGDTFNYLELRNKAKTFRTKHPDVAGIRVGAEEGITVEVLARTISQLRGPKCSVEPGRCWLPEVAFGDRVRTPSASASKPKVQFSKLEEATAAPGTVEIGKAKVAKGMDASKVDAVLRRRAGFARMCYFAALVEEPKLAGIMDLRLTVGKDGAVIEVGVPESSLGSEAVEACLTRGLKGLRFAVPGNAPVAIDVSLTFKRQ